MQKKHDNCMIKLEPCGECPAGNEVVFDEEDGLSFGCYREAEGAVRVDAVHAVRWRFRLDAGEVDGCADGRESVGGFLRGASAAGDGLHRDGGRH